MLSKLLLRRLIAVTLSRYFKARLSIILRIGVRGLKIGGGGSQAAASSISLSSRTEAEPWLSCRRHYFEILR